MDGEGIDAADLAGLMDRPVEDAPWRGCLVAGCACMDARILSLRRARFHAYLARTRGESADRVIAPDPGWRLPTTSNQEG
jgi:hypothetical protein